MLKASKQSGAEKSAPINSGGVRVKFLPQQIKKFRQLNGLSIETASREVAKLGGHCSARTWQKWEAGKTFPNTSIFGLVCKVLRMTPDKFYSTTAKEFRNLLMLILLFMIMPINAHAVQECNSVEECRAVCSDPERLPDDLKKAYYQLREIAEAMGKDASSVKIRCKIPEQFKK